MLSTTRFYQSFNFTAAADAPGIPSWLRLIRQGDVHQLAQAGIPVSRDENWKYSSLAPILEQSFVLQPRIEGILPDKLKEKYIAGAHNITVFNGHLLLDDAWGLAQRSGISILEGPAAYEALTGQQSFFTQVTPNDPELFARLNRSLFDDPLVIIVDKGVVFDGLVHIVNVVTTSKAAVFPRLFIRAGSGAVVNVLQTYVSLPSKEYLSVPVTDIRLEPGAKVEYVERHEHSSHAFHIGSIRVWLEKEAVFRSFISTSGAALYRNNLSVMMGGEGASAEVNGLHALGGDNHADSHTFLEHSVPNTTSNQLYKCVLEGKSRSVFNGRVFVHREAQQTNSYQLNKNLLLNPGCRVDTKPQLEIKADDVKCTHGATIGRLDEEQLFYLQTRAVGKEDAVRMLVRGFVDDVLERIAHPLIRDAFKKG